MTYEGREYLGTANTTASGQACIPWSETNIRLYAANVVFPDGSLDAAENYCRNIRLDNFRMKDDVPFCFSSNDHTPRSCNISFCPEIGL